MEQFDSVIINLSKSLRDIEVRKDVAALEAFIHQDFQAIDPSGATITKSEHLNRYRMPEFLINSYELIDITAKVFGQAALEMGIMELSGSIRDFEFAGKYRYSHYWVKELSGWQIIASQMTPIVRETAAS